MVIHKKHLPVNVVCNVNLQISKNYRDVITYSGQIVKVNSHNYLDIIYDIINDYMLSLFSFLLSIVYIRVFNVNLFKLFSIYVTISWLHQCFS